MGPMKCPVCTLAPKEGSVYRVTSSSGEAHPELASLPHPSGVILDACPLCGGVWLDKGELERIETRAERSEGPRATSVDFVRRAYEEARRVPREPLSCPSCGEEMAPREWSIGTLVMVDVCLECRGVWLDGGELEALEAVFR